MSQPKGIPVAPLTGILDIRSSPDLLPQGALRWRQNMQTVGENKLRRGEGWMKALNQSPYNNQDFHDQLLLFGGTVREPVTGMFEFQSARGIRSLWLTTQSRIAKLNETTGNWRIIASGLGGGAGTDCSGPRFKAANVGDYVIFTNGHDRPKVHRLEQPPFDDVLIADLPDLETIGLTKAALAWAWKDVVFLADVEMDGERHGNRIVWGDFKNPTSFDPSKPESIAGFKDLNYGERILNGGPTTAGTYLVYTTQAIWEISVVGGDQVFAWREAYPGKKADYVGCLKYQNTLVDIGGDHLYMAKDGIYAFNPYRSSPELVLWLHRATPVLFDDIDDTACAASFGWFHDGEAFWSVKRNSDSGCPGVTLRVETEFKVADTIDHGFTAAVNFRPQPIQTIRDFILDKRICNLEGLTDSLLENGLRPPFENEGLPAPFAPPSVAAEDAPNVFWTHQTQTIDGVTTEDWNKTLADSDSLCALLGDVTLDDLCQGCETVSVLLAASSQDWCLKQFGGFYRERTANPTATGSTETSVRPTNTGVDFVFVVDESATMTDARLILASVTANLEASLNAVGVGNGTIPNRYACVAFGIGRPAETEVDFTTPAAFAAAAGTIGLTPDSPPGEDAYEGIDYAISELSWREQSTVTKVIFFITDEDRNVHNYDDGGDQAEQFINLKAELVAGGFVLAGMTQGSLNGVNNGAGTNAIIGADYTTNPASEPDGTLVSLTGKSYYANGSGGYIETLGVDTLTTNWRGDTAPPGEGQYPDTGVQSEYFALLMDQEVKGYWFDLFLFRQSAAYKSSINALIVPALAERITMELINVQYTSAVGSYILDGYDSIIRFAPLWQEMAEVILERFVIKGIPAVQADPSLIELRTGIAGQTADPNDDRCPIVWYDHTPRELRCVTDRTEAQHITARTVPSQDISWRFFRKGKWLCIELSITGTGGDCILSGAVALAKATPARNF